MKQNSAIGLVFFTAIAVVGGCCLKLEKNALKERNFEGIIVYELSYSKIDRLSKKQLERVYGTRMVRRYKESATRDEYYNAGDELLKTVIVSKKDHRWQMVLRGGDTTKVYYPYYSDEYDKTLLGDEYCTCGVRSVEAFIHSYHWNGELFNSVRIILSKEIPIESSWYYEPEELGYHQLMRINPGIELVMEKKVLGSIQTIKCKRIRWQKLNEELFRI